MPIYGLTNVQESFLKLGQIRKGDKDEEGRPRDLDYFRVTFLPWKTKDGQDGAALLEKRFLEQYGPRPTEINIRLAYPDVRKVWDANFECYKKGGMFASACTDATGAHWIFRRDDTTNEVIIRDGQAVNDEGVRFLTQPLDIHAPLYSYKSTKGEMVQVGFDPVGHLFVVVRELADLAVGFFEFRPESPRDIRNISSELASFDLFAKQAGKDISGMPFILRRRDEQVPKRIGNQLSRGSSWVVHLDLGGDWANKALQVIERKALPEFIEAEEVIEVPQSEPTDAKVAEQEPPAIEKTSEAPKAKAPVDPEETEVIDPLDSRAIGFAANVWNISLKKAREAIDKAILTGTLKQPFYKAAFKRFVKNPQGEPPTA